MTGAIRRYCRHGQAQFKVGARGGGRRCDEIPVPAKLPRGHRAAGHGGGGGGAPILRAARDVARSSDLVVSSHRSRKVVVLYSHGLHTMRLAPRDPRLHAAAAAQSPKRAAEGAASSRPSGRLVGRRLVPPPPQRRLAAWERQSRDASAAEVCAAWRRQRRKGVAPTSRLRSPRRRPGARRRPSPGASPSCPPRCAAAAAAAGRAEAAAPRPSAIAELAPLRVASTSRRRARRSVVASSSRARARDAALASDRRARGRGSSSSLCAARPSLQRGASAAPRVSGLLRRPRCTALL